MTFLFFESPDPRDVFFTFPDERETGPPHRRPGRCRVETRAVEARVASTTSLDHGGLLARAPSVSSEIAPPVSVLVSWFLADLRSLA